MANQNADQNIITTLGLDNLPEEQKAQMLEQMNDLVQKRLLLRVLDSLDDDKRAEYEQLLDQEDQNAINSFIQQNVPQFKDWLFEEVYTLKSELSDRAEKLEREE